jgi:hypothetical protein
MMLLPAAKLQPDGSEVPESVPATPLVHVLAVPTALEPFQPTTVDSALHDVIALPVLLKMAYFTVAFVVLSTRPVRLVLPATNDLNVGGSLYVT